MRTQGVAALALGCAVQLGFQPAIIYVPISVKSFLSLPRMRTDLPCGVWWISLTRNLILHSLCDSCEKKLAIIF